MADEMPRWRFSPLQLARIRRDVNARSARQIADIRFETKAEGEAPPTMTADEDALLLQYYLGKAVDVCIATKMGLRIQSTALTYMKRFYLRYSCMDFHPKHVLLTAIFVASKTEEMYMTVDEFLKRMQQKNSLSALLLTLEVLLMQAVNFELVVPNPFEALYGLYVDMLAQAVLPPADAQPLHEAAQNLVSKSLLSDALFYYQPSQIALSAMHTAAVERGVQTQMFRYLQTRFGRKPAELAAIETVITAVRDHVQSIAAVSALTVKPIDSKLNGCRNPAFDMDSDYYKRLKEQEGDQFDD